GHQIGRTGTAHTKVLFGRAVHNVLGCGISMYRGHNSLLYPDPSVQDFYYRTYIIGGTAGAGKNGDLAIFRIYPMNNCRGILAFGRGRYDNRFGPSLDMLFGILP